MLVELHENEFKYIYKCFEQLLPQYCQMIEKTLHIDDYLKNHNLSDKVIYSFDLDLKTDDIEQILSLKNKLKKPKNTDEFELSDTYTDFFFFVENYTKQRNCKKL